MNQQSQQLYFRFVQSFIHAPTQRQDGSLRMLAEFVLGNDSRTLFLLKGYAGTGKTSIISSIVRNLGSVGLKSVLMAPTGRAAKVMAVYSKRPAFTIHKRIYFATKSPQGGMTFVLQKNKYTNTIFIVDEASMIPDGDPDARIFEKRSLLNDLISYVYSGKNCKLILVGDTAQLPPVKSDRSPALDEQRLEVAFDLRLEMTELDEVMRQHSDSGILINATKLRQLLSLEALNQYAFDLDFPDIERLTDGYDIQDAIFEAYSGKLENTVFIVRSNKRANQYNQQIRHSILGYDSEICAGDFIMVVKNNYFWLEDSTEVGFIANGDIAEILEVFKFSDLYGFRFAEVKLRLVDYPNQPPFETMVLLDTLHSESASLSYEDSNRIYKEIAKDYEDVRPKSKRLVAIKNDRYFNALQIKFSYAMTCHKTQGGQWETVFVEQPYLPDGENISYLRWLYTALTRAQKNLFLIGFKDEYFEE